MRCTYITNLCEVTDSMITQQQHSKKALETLSNSPINVYFVSSQFNYEKNHTRVLASILHEDNSSFFLFFLKSYHLLAKVGPS